MTYFVKFVPYNANTLSSLLNKTIKFSTVYEFNDANELNYIASPQVEAKDFQIHADLKAMLDDLGTRWLLFENSLKSGRHDRQYMSQFKEKLSKYTNNLGIFDPNEMRVLIENLAFSSVGIFCTSNMDVFCDDSAQLMFAHYADNLKGLALIYNIDNNKHSIEYNSGYKVTICNQCGQESINKEACEAALRPGSMGIADRASKWIAGDFTDISDFKSKSKKWEYEQEFRIFNKPSIASAKDSGVELKAILYTSRFNLDNVTTLETINNKIYDSNLKIKEIYNSHSNYEFRMFKENERSIKWLKSLK